VQTSEAPFIQTSHDLCPLASRVRIYRLLNTASVHEIQAELSFFDGSLSKNDGITSASQNNCQPSVAQQYYAIDTGTALRDDAKRKLPQHWDRSSTSPQRQRPPRPTHSL